MTLGSMPADTIPEPPFETELLVGKADRLQLEVAVADGRDDQGPTVVSLLPWSERVDRPDARDRYRLMAQALGGRVVAVNTLGVGHNTSQMPRSVRRDVSRGNFEPMSEITWQAMTDAVPDLGEQLQGFSYSQGSTLQASLMATAPRDVVFDQVTFAESAGLATERLWRLAMEFGRESVQWRKHYLALGKVAAHTPDWMARPGSEMPGVIDTMRDSSSLVAIPQGMARASMFAMLYEAFDRGAMSDSGRLTFVNNSQSIISRTADNHRLAGQLDRLGYLTDVEAVTVQGESHGMIDAPSLLYEFLQRRGV